jgi:hypothetical protein
MNSDMAFECLFVSRDPGIFGTMSPILRDLGISTDMCLTSAKAFNQLKTGQTDLVVIDWEGEDSSDLLQDIWKSARKKKPTIVAISSLDRPIPGAHVVLKKPVTAESSQKSLQAAYSRMLFEHRRHARFALMVSVKATDESRRNVSMTITDIGDGGLGLVTKAKLFVGDVLSFHVLLPGAIRKIYMQVRILWTRDYSRFGCEFLRIPPVDLNILNEWIKRKSEIKKPLIAV